MSFWTWIKGIGAKVGDALKQAFGSKPAQDFARGALAILATALGQLALSAVRDANMATLSNEEKRQVAFERIKSEAQEAGLSVADSVINLAIETALQFLKGNIGPA